MPFQFFGEKEIHYEVCKELKDLREDPRDQEMRIIRECPTSKCYIKEGSLLKESKNGRRALIDLVIKHPSGNMGFEFYFGKHTPPIEQECSGNIYLLKRRSLSCDEVLTHTLNDCLKLSGENLICSRVVLLIGAYHKTQRSKEHFIEHKRNKIVEGLGKIKEEIPENITLYYIEQSYVGGLNNREPRYRRVW